MSAQKDATKITEAANKALYDAPNLDWGDTLGSEFAQRGLIAAIPAACLPKQKTGLCQAI